MFTYEKALITLSALGVVGVPIYLYLRSRMVKSDFSYSKRHIVKVVLLHMASMSGITLLHSFILISLLHNIGNVSLINFQNFIFQIILLGIALYGGGMYITCILVEHFSARRSKQVTYLQKTLRLIHGPLSHITFEIAYLVAFWNIALIQQKLGLFGSMEYSSMFFWTGVVTGVALALALIGNGTYLFVGLIAAATFPLFISIVTMETTGGIYNWGLMIACVTTILIFVSIRLLTGHRVKIYEPINFFSRT